MNPNSDLVAVAWLAGIAGLSADMVATILPRDQTTWAEDGFVTVNVIGGNPDLTLPIRRPVIQVDCWAVTPNSARPPWGEANRLAELIRTHVEAGPAAANHSRLLTFSGDYQPASVMAAIMRTEPRRGVTPGPVPTGDPGGYARFMFDLELAWRLATT